jgi:hypothetical protein
VGELTSMRDGGNTIYHERERVGNKISRGEKEESKERASVRVRLVRKQVRGHETRETREGERAALLYSRTCADLVVLLLSVLLLLVHVLNRSTLSLIVQ